MSFVLFQNLKPAVEHVAVVNARGRDGDGADELRVGVVLVSHFENEFRGVVAQLDPGGRRNGTVGEPLE